MCLSDRWRGSHFCRPLAHVQMAYGTRAHFAVKPIEPGCMSPPSPPAQGTPGMQFAAHRLGRRGILLTIASAAGDWRNGTDSPCCHLAAMHPSELERK